VSPEDVEAIERDTVAAVAPPGVLEIDGWLVPLDNGTIGRAKSAVPLRHDVGPDAVGEIVAAYRQRSLPPAFRIAEVGSLDPVRAQLSRHGLAPQQPTVFKTGSIARLAAFSEASARILAAPNAAWAALFLGEGFDPVDGAHRVAALTRSPGAIYAAAGEGDATHAVGVMSFGARWAGIHGMRTAPAYRRKGLASAVLAAMARAAQARGVERVLLQVEAPNPARRLYRAAGFTEAWIYRYWR
jgi:N-acetylglutamate synthase